jgi:hypothetical protein
MKLLNTYLFISLSIYCFGQRKNNIGHQYSHFQLIQQKDTIDFVVADTNLTIKKPILLFCQGSQPTPLFFNFEEQGIIPVTLNNFNVNEMKKNYHIVVISMPKTPLIVGQDHLNKSYNYVLDTTQEYSYSPEFLKADYLENYVKRANYVLKYLSKQKWVDKNKIVVAGHSQGSHVALAIASSNKKITQLGLFGFNPLGRIDQYIRKARKDAEQGIITWEDADLIQNNTYDDYRNIQNTDSIKQNPMLNSWKSFSKSQTQILINLNIPIYITYGSDDINADFCDLLPLYFIEKNKKNLTLKRFPNLEHNFFPKNESGELDYQNGKWEFVMNEFIKWSIN